MNYRCMTNCEFLMFIENYRVCQDPVVAELVRRLAQASGSPVVAAAHHIDDGVVGVVTTALRSTLRREVSASS